LKKTEAEKNEEEKPSEEFVKKVNYDYKLSEELQNLLVIFLYNFLFFL